MSTFIINIHVTTCNRYTSIILDHEYLPFVVTTVCVISLLWAFYRMWHLGCIAGDASIAGDAHPVDAPGLTPSGVHEIPTYLLCSLICRSVLNNDFFCW